MWKEFKEFITRGSVMDLAVGVIIGAAFTAIVTSLVNNIIMPLIGIITGGLDFSEWEVTIGGATIEYGLFIGAVINFLLVALVIFLLVKGINGLRRKKDDAPAPKWICPYCRSEVDGKATKCPHCTADMTPVAEQEG